MNFIDTLAQILLQVWYLLPLFMLLTIFKAFIDKKEKELKKEKNSRMIFIKKMKKMVKSLKS